MAGQILITAADERLDDLETAYEWIHAASEGLDTTKKECDCCGLGKYDNIFEYRLHQQLKGLMGKVQKLKDYIADHTVARDPNFKG